MSGPVAGAAAMLAAGVILSAHASARGRVFGRSAVTEWLHVAAGAAIIGGVIALAWLALARWPDGGVPAELGAELGGGLGDAFGEVIPFRLREAA